MTWYSIEELRQRPELMLPPAPILPHLAWEGRVTLLVGREKLGKSTLIRQAVAAMAAGQPFLDRHPGRRVPVGWLALDEALGDLVRGLDEAGATSGIIISEERPDVEALGATVEREALGLLVVDTLGEFLAGLVESMNDAAQVVTPVATLRALARQTKCAIVVLHHQNKAGTGYLGSVAIGAGVDAIATFTEADEGLTRRSLKLRGRGVHANLTLDFDLGTGRYGVAEGDLSLEAQLVTAVSREPGIGHAALRRTVSGRNHAKDGTIKGLLHRGTIVDRGDERGHRYYLAEANWGNPGARGAA